MNFEQILQSKIKEQSSRTDQATKLESLDAQGVDPAHLSFLLGHISRRATPPMGKYPTRPGRPARKAHVLNETQTQAYAFLKALCPEIPEGFTSAELKTAFRQAALQLHPDCGGSPQDFITLREHYRNLSLVLASPT